MALGRFSGGDVLRYADEAHDISGAVKLRSNNGATDAELAVGSGHFGEEIDGLFGVNDGLIFLADGSGVAGTYVVRDAVEGHRTLLERHADDLKEVFRKGD